MTQPQAVIETIEMLGGVATLNQINQNIFKIEDCKWGTKTPFASIRRIVRHTNGIYRIKPGLYALESNRKQLENNGIVVQTEQNQDSETVKVFNHAYYQGLLLEMGKMRHFNTFVPDQDKNRLFLNQATLGEIKTLDTIPQYTYSNLVKRSSTIDVIWFNDRQMPHSFFEIEHSTDIQNSLLKFNDLQDLYVRMVIVADEKRRNEFLTKMKYAAFVDLKTNDRVHFLNYDSLDKQYEREIEMQSCDFII